MLGPVEIDFEWGKSDDRVDKPIHCRSTFWVRHRGKRHGVCRGGILTSELLRQCGYNPSMVGGADFGFGLERLAMPKLDIDDIHVLWQPPYVPDTGK